MNSYRTVQSESESTIVEKSSKFIAYCCHISNKEDADNFINKIKALHPKARHWCYAYRIGLDQNNYRTNDDGEPSGTAGKPILAQIDSLQLNNIMVIVVRYFGGILLGTGGLVKAYKSATASVLKQSIIVEVDIKSCYIIQTNNINIYKILKIIKDFEFKYQDLIIDNLCSIKVFILKKSEEIFFKKLKTILESEEPKPNENVYHIRDCNIEFLNISND